MCTEVFQRQVCVIAINDSSISHNLITVTLSLSIACGDSGERGRRRGF